MAVISDYLSVPDAARGAAVALGNFDGVHAGHRAVINSAKVIADRNNIPLAVLIFEPPPRRYFQPDSPPFRIMRPEMRRDAMRALGVEVIYELPFNAEMANLTPESFVRDVLVDGLRLSHLSVGFDFRFGKGRAGDTALLEREAEALNFSLSVMEPVTTGHAKISSTAIREALTEGRPRDAAELLGAYWVADGVIELGEQRGRTINFPTANVRLGNLINPRHGVYSVWARVEGHDGWRPGVANFGRTPTTGERDPLLEVHLFDFEGDIYGRQMDVAFAEFIRPERKFESFEALTTQIAADAQTARDALAVVGKAQPMIVECVPLEE